MLFAFDYDHVAKNFHKSDELLVLKSFDINETFLENPAYIQSKNSINRLKLHYFRKSIIEGGVVFNTLKGIVQKSKVPDSFLYMAMIESKFLISAKSHKKAVGLWQILPKTAKLLNLKINKSVDERLDPVKSTKAALKYLTYLHKRFHKWYLAAMAYNCGESRLASAIKKAGSDDIDTLMDPNCNYIPKETKAYILRLLNAALIARTKPIKEVIAKAKQEKQLKKVNIVHNTTLKRLAKRLKVSYKTILNYNQHIKSRSILSQKGVLSIYIPKNYKSGDDLKNRKKIRYKIKEGDTLLKIAKKFNISIKTLRKLNKGLTIILPVGKVITVIDNRIKAQNKTLKTASKK